MAYIPINNGTFDNDPSADKIRIAFDDTKTMFQELYGILGNTVTIKENIIPFVEGSGSLLNQATASINAYAGVVPHPCGTIQIFSFTYAPGSEIGEGFSAVNELQKISYAVKIAPGVEGTTYGAFGSTQLNVSDLILWSKTTEQINDNNTIELGDIGSTEVQDYVNANGPYQIDGFTLFTATIDNEFKIYAFAYNSGVYGVGETQTTEDDFIDLTTAPEIVVPNELLPIKTITDNPYTLLVDDLNRPLIFTSNNQVVNIEDTLVGLAADAGLTLYDFIAYFQGTGTHTINHPQGGEWTGTQGALVKGLCIDISGDSLWVIKQWGDSPTPPTPLTLLNQYNQSSTTGDTQANLLQPDFGVAIFTSEDMQAGSSYKGEIYLEIDNNHTGTAKIIDLFGIGIFSATSAIPEINGKLTFDIDFYNQAGNIITYRVSYGFTSPGLQFYGSEESTINNTASADIYLAVNGDASDNIRVNKAKIKRENLKGIL